MNEISNDTSSDSSVTSVFSTNCSLISSILAFVIIGMILSFVHSGNDATGASTLTITSLYISCHEITSSFNVSHIWAISAALCAAISSKLSLSVSIADHVKISPVRISVFHVRISQLNWLTSQVNTLHVPISTVSHVHTSCSEAFISTITSSNSPFKIHSKLSNKNCLICSFCSAVPR